MNFWRCEEIYNHHDRNGTGLPGVVGECKVTGKKVYVRSQTKQAFWALCKRLDDECSCGRKHRVPGAYELWDQLVWQSTGEEDDLYGFTRPFINQTGVH